MRTFIVLALLLVSCTAPDVLPTLDTAAMSAQLGTPTPPPEPQTPPLITLHHAGCAMGCAAYTIALWHNGVMRSAVHSGGSINSIHWTSINTDDPQRIAGARQAIDAAVRPEPAPAIQHLLDLLDAGDFAADYPQDNPDLERISITYGAPPRTITYYHGSPTAPAMLPLIAYHIDYLAGVQRWLDPLISPLPRLDGALPLVALEHEACALACPVYSVAVWPNGIVQYVGSAHVATTGTLTSTLSAEQISQLIDLARRHHDESAMRYRFEITQGATAIISMVNLQGEISALYSPMFGTALKANGDPLLQLQLDMEQVIDTNRWTGLSDLTQSAEAVAEPALPLHNGSEPTLILAQSDCATCETYTATLWEDGTLRFEGYANVAVTGVQTATLTPDQVAHLLNYRRNSTAGPSPAPGMPRSATEPLVSLTVRMPGSYPANTATQHASGDISIPAALRALEAEFSAILAQQGWIAQPLNAAMFHNGALPIVSLSRDMCLGYCPVYTVAIWTDGLVRFEGQNYVQIPGVHLTQIEPDEVAQLDRLFAQSGYLELLPLNRGSSIDVPQVGLTYTHNGASSATFYTENYPHVPPFMDPLASAVDSVAGTARWIGH